MRYRLKVFLLLTALLLVGVVGWQLVRDRSRADEREAWAAVVDSVVTQKARIDSFEGLLGRLDARVTEGKRQLGSMQERIAHYEHGADEGRLPTPQFREYSRTVEGHNDLVLRYNRAVVEMQRVYQEYSELIDTQNAWLDSASAMQRRATQEGYTLPEDRWDDLEGLPRR
jgi:hypothetical protein